MCFRVMSDCPIHLFHRTSKSSNWSKAIRYIIEMPGSTVRLPGSTSQLPNMCILYNTSNCYISVLFILLTPQIFVYKINSHYLIAVQPLLLVSEAQSFWCWWFQECLEKLGIKMISKVWGILQELQIFLLAGQYGYNDDVDEKYKQQKL